MIITLIGIALLIVVITGFLILNKTKAFEAIEAGGYIEADVMKEISFDSEWGIWGDSWEEVCKNCNDTPDNVANDMHDRVVSELIDKIKGQ